MKKYSDLIKEIKNSENFKNEIFSFKNNSTDKSLAMFKMAGEVAPDCIALYASWIHWNLFKSGFSKDKVSFSSSKETK